MEENESFSMGAVGSEIEKSTEEETKTLVESVNIRNSNEILKQNIQNVAIDNSDLETLIALKK